MSTQSPFTPPDHDAQRGHRPPNIRPPPYATSQSTPFESGAQLDLHILTAKRRLRTVKHELDNAIAERESEERIKELKLEVLDADLEYYEAKLDKKMVHIRARMEKECLEKGFPVPEQGMPRAATSRNVYMGSQPCSRTYSHETRVLTPGNPPHCRIPQPIVNAIPAFTKNSAVTTGTLNTVSGYRIQSKRDDAPKEPLTFLVPDEQGHQLQISALSRIDAHHDISPPGLPPLVSSLELTKQPVPAPLNNPLVHQSCSGTPVREIVVNGGGPHDHTCSSPLSPITTVSENVSENDTVTTGTILTATDNYAGSDHGNAPSELTLTFHGRVEQPCQSGTLAPSQTVVHHSVTTPAPIDSKPFIVPTLEPKQPVLAPSNDPLAHQPCNCPGGTPSCETGAPKGISHDHVVTTVSENNTAMPGIAIPTAVGHCAHPEHDNASDELTLASLGHDVNEQPHQTFVPSQTVVHHLVATPTPVDLKSSGVSALESQPFVPAPFFIHVFSASCPPSIVLARRNTPPSTYGYDPGRWYGGSLCAVSQRICYGALPQTPPRRKPPWKCYPWTFKHSLQRASPLCLQCYLLEVKSDVSLLPGNM
ncbi:hypothetical protein V5O48_017456 [Marasmius crinis-equi]|uniref:Uncharacterized protein n=1 Tax=Marasmius crinis-equi TaxID=585013 RepID=A0ABR3ENX4_9AGAR